METSINDGNKLIALSEFSSDDIKHRIKIHNFLNRSDLYRDEESLKYHESWEWLMPVVEKIENIKDEEGSYMFSIKHGRDYCVITFNDIARDVICAMSVSNDKILTLWQAIVKFIQWYTTFKNKSYSKKIKKGSARKLRGR